MKIPGQKLVNLIYREYIICTIKIIIIIRRRRRRRKLVNNCNKQGLLENIC